MVKSKSLITKEEMESAVKATGLTTPKTAYEKRICKMMTEGNTREQIRDELYLTDQGSREAWEIFKPYVLMDILKRADMFKADNILRTTQCLQELGTKWQLNPEEYRRFLDLRDKMLTHLDESNQGSGAPLIMFIGDDDDKTVTVDGHEVVIEKGKVIDGNYIVQTPLPPEESPCEQSQGDAGVSGNSEREDDGGSGVVSGPTPKE
jgi:hypothetical protein